MMMTGKWTWKMKRPIRLELVWLFWENDESFLDDDWL